MRPTIKVVVTDNSQKAAKSFRDLARLQVLVGIPEKNAARKKGVITNAQLAFIHTHGVRWFAFREAMQKTMKSKGMIYSAALAMYIHTYGSALFMIPPRPIIEPAIEEPGNKKIIADAMKLAAKASLDGNATAVRSALSRAGMTAQNIVRAWFTDPRNHWPPNAPSTIKRKGSDKPLINEGELRKAITYVVAEK